MSQPKRSPSARARSARDTLQREARRLDDTLAEAGLRVVGGTSLFRLVQTPTADALFRHLGERGILVRRFAEQPHWIRFGLPASEPAWTRLRSALAALPVAAQPA